MRMRNSFETNLPVEIYKGRQASTATSRSQTKRHDAFFVKYSKVKRRAWFLIDQKRKIIPSEASEIFEAELQHVTEISMGRFFV